jgi:hypothetical protein
MMEKQSLGEAAFDEFGNEVFDLEDYTEEDDILESLIGKNDASLGQSGNNEKPDSARPKTTTKKGKRRILISPDGIITEVIMQPEVDALTASLSQSK